MAFSDLGTLGSGGSKTANQASIALTTTAAAEVGHLVVLVVACDNNQTTDGDEGAVTSVTDSNGNNVWNKAIEMCNGQGTAQTGATISIWFSVLRGQINSAGTITANLSNSASRDATGILAWEFGMAAGSAVVIGATNTSVGDGAAMTSSLNATTVNREALRFRAWGGEEELTTAMTPTSGWTNVGTAANSGTGGVNTSNIILCGEFHISTGTSDASAPTGGVTCDWASGYVAFYEWAFLPYCWQVQPWQPPIPPFRQRHIGPQSSTARGADPAPESPFIDWNWPQTEALTKSAAAIGQRFAATAGPTNIPSPYVQWVNDGWPVQPPQPPRPLRTNAAPLPAPLNIPSPYTQWVNAGWPFQATQPPHQPNIKQAAAAVAGATNVEAPYSQWVNGGWEPNQPSALPRDPSIRSMGAQLQAAANIEIIYQNWQNAGWTPTLPNPLAHPPATRLFAGVLPAATNIEAVYSQWVNDGWRFQPPQPPHQPATRQNAGQFPAPVNIDAVFVPWINAGWDPDLPQPLIRRPLTRHGAAALPDATNIPSIFQDWKNLGWGAQPPQPPAFRRYQALPEFTWRYDVAPPTTVNWGFDPLPVQPRYWQRYIGPVRLPSSGPAPPTLEWGFVPNNPQPPIPATLLRAGGVLNAWRNNEDVYVFTGGVTFGWDPPSFTPPAPTGRRLAGTVGPLNVPSPYVQWVNLGWEPDQPSSLPRDPAIRFLAGQLPGPLNIEGPYVQWINAGWTPSLPLPLAHPPATRQFAGGLPAAANVEVVYSQWVNDGWKVQPPQPPKQPAAKQAAAQLPAALNIDQPYTQWVNSGWEADLPSPLIRTPRTSQSAAALPDAANIPIVFQDWRNLGWGAQQPQPPASRRYQALPEFTWRYDAAPPTTVGWGFDPLPTSPASHRFAGQLPSATNIEAVFSQWLNAGWEIQPPLTAHQPATKLVGAQLQAALNIDPPYTQWVNGGWQATLPVPLTADPALRQTAAAMPAAANVEITYTNWINAGWAPTLPAQLPHPPASRLFAGQLPGPTNIEVVYSQWVNDGWEAVLPQPLTVEPAVRQRGAQLPSAINIDPPYVFIPAGGFSLDWNPPATTAVVGPGQRLAATAGPVNIPSPYVQWLNTGWDAVLPQPLHSPATRHVAAPLNIEFVFQNWQNAGWTPTLPTPLVHSPAIRQDAAALPAAANIEFVYQPWTNVPWQIEPSLLPTRRPERGGAALPSAGNIDSPFAPFTPYGWPAEQPRLPHPRPERVGAVLRGDDGIAGQFSYFLGYGWEVPSPQPPHTRWERAAASLPAAVNIESRFESWVNSGWLPVLPTLPAFRRLFAMPELSWRADQVTPVAHEWGFQPTVPEGLRDWFTRAAAIMPGANIDTPFIRFLPSGWQQIGGWSPPAFRRYLPPSTAVVRGFSPNDLFVVPHEWGFEPVLHGLPRRRWERSAAGLPAQLNLVAPFIFVQAVLPPWVGQVPSILALPHRFVGGLASKSQFGSPDFFPLYGWQTQSPQPPMPRWRQIAGMAVGDNIEGPFEQFLSYGWAPTDPRPLIRPGVSARPAAALSGAANIATTFVRWINSGWEADLPQPLLHQPLVRQGAATTPGPTNIEFVYQPWTNRGWQIEPTLLRGRRSENSASILPSGDNIEGQFERFLAYGWPAELPRLPHPRPEKAGSIERGDDGTEAQFEAFRPYAWDAQPVQPPHQGRERAGAIQTKDDGIEAAFQAWVNAGWQFQPPQPPRRPWERSAASLPAAFNIDPRFEAWVNLGWRPALPELPAFRRLFAMPELTWRADPIFNFVVVPHEWGFQPLVPEGIRDWFIRAAAVMPGSNIAAPLVGFLPAGWAPQYTDILAKPPRRFPVSAEIFAPAQAIRWINAGWEATLPLLTGDPAVRLRGAQLPATVNIDPQFEAFLAHGWQVLPPHLRHPRPEAAGSIQPKDDGIEDRFSSFVPYGWQAQPPQPPHGKWDKAAAILRGVDGIDARFENWINTGWLPVLPTLPAFRRLFSMPEFTWRPDQASVVVPYNWGFQSIIPDALRSWQNRAGGIMPVANIEAAFVNWINAGWDPNLPLPLTRDPALRLAAAGLLTPPGNIDAPFLPWINAGWEATLPLLTRDPAIYLRGGQLQAAFNIDPLYVFVQTFLSYGWEALPPHLRHPRPEAAGAILVGDPGIADLYNQWRNLGWGLQPFQPPRPRWEKTGAVLIGDAGIADRYNQWRNLGWGAQPFQPPRRPWEKNAGAIMRGANIEAKYEQWRNQGWVPTLPMLRIVRRAIDLSDFTWRTDTFGPVAHNWGFVPITPEGLRTWFNRAAAIEAIHRPADEFIFVQGVTTEFLQTYFIANMTRFMNRRG